MMRKMFINLFVTGMTAFTLCACGTGEQTTNNAAAASDTEEVTISEVVEETASESVNEVSAPATIDLAIGTTGYIITIPSDYYGAEVTEKESPDRLKGDTVAYKNLLAGILVEKQQKAFSYLRLLDTGAYSHEQVLEIIHFVQDELCCRREDIKQLEDAELVSYLRCKLNRPMRVCGVVMRV